MPSESPLGVIRSSLKLTWQIKIWQRIWHMFILTACLTAIPLGIFTPLKKYTMYSSVAGIGFLYRFVWHTTVYNTIYSNITFGTLRQCFMFFHCSNSSVVAVEK